MKNEILDDIFKDDFRELIKKDEKVIWEGRPVVPTFTKWSTGLGLVIVILMIFSFVEKKAEIINFIYPICFGVLLLIRLWQSQKFRYLITDQRVLFQLWEKPNDKFWKRRKKIIKEIPLDQIKNISVRKNNSTNGAILIQPKTKQYHFNSKNLKTGEGRYKPSIEMIDNVEEVAEYLRKEMHKDFPN